MDALSRAAIRVEILSTLLHTSADPVLRRRYGFQLARRDGVACFTAQRGLFGDARTFGHRAVGFGTTVRATQATLDRVRRLYDARGGPCRILVVEGMTSPEALRFLRRNGFHEEQFASEWHALVTTRPPPVPDLGPVEIQRASADQAALFSTTARDAGGDTGRVREYFQRTVTRLLREHPRLAAGFLATSRGRPAGTGGLLLSGDGGALFSGAVLPRYRGRGIQNGLIATRIAYGVGRGVRYFVSQTYQNPISAQNLADLGFRRRWRMVHWTDR